MNDVDSATKLAELLRHPDDLDKIPALKSEFTRKKAAVDGQLRVGLKEQLEVTQAGMSSIQEGQRAVNMIKEEMMKIDKLCAESQNMIRDFPNINIVSQTHRNFDAVEKMKKDIDSFLERIENLEYLLGQDDEDPANQPNLLEIHYGLTQLRDIRDRALDQIKSSDDPSTELIDNLQLETGATVQDCFSRLEEVVEWFDKHVGEACLNLIELVQAGNDGMVVRLALVIEEEEKSDKKAKALQDAQKEYSNLASRLKSIASGPKELRGYKEKFITSIEYVCKARVDESNELFQEEPDKLEKSVKWYFNNLNTVKLGMQALMPKKWKIFRTYVNIYHQHMHDWMIERIEDQVNTNPQHLLAILNWVDKYYSKMKKLGVPEEELAPHIIDNRGTEIIGEYKGNIVKKVEEWMNRIGDQDKLNFTNRDESALDQDENGWYRTKTLGDMWLMVYQNLDVAAGSERTDICEGVADAMFRALSSRQRMWQTLIEADALKVTLDDEQGFHDWLIAVANDQINCIAEDEGDGDGSVSFLARFGRNITPMVSAAYTTTLAAQIETLRDGYVDLATTSLKFFVSAIFTIDFRNTIQNFFTTSWYSQKDMESIVITFRDYLGEYTAVLHPSLRDILIEEMADELLSHYLSAVRNKGVKFRRSDQFEAKIKDDLLTVFEFFGQYGPGQDIRSRWRVIQQFLDLLQADKANVPVVYEQFKHQYWDIPIGWVEAVLRARDDFDRSMLNAVKAKAAEVNVERGEETIMSKVK
ncbi:exocyst complex component Sec6-domain-containing protein [Lophiotrema nucula]|uniref:Exocyst complex component Sec6-domain-containing protein n=1 Tax=Lophiotrema nucula TaxID=690887 RepID=A0A6A5YJW3_9PLEO|nr:exocyst complex component Sec6-domain-containing protein [Lophiotrema nucula]